MAYFPMFIDLTGQSCLVVGGGRIALRKVQVLLDFDAHVTVVASEICDEIKKIGIERNRADNVNASIQDESTKSSGMLGNLSLHERKFIDSDIEGKALVVAATNNEELNERISTLCQKANIPINVVDDKEKCSFIFPSYIKEKNLVGAFSSGGNSPVLSKFLKDEMSDVLTSQMGELNEILGRWRPEILKKYPNESERKEFFERVIEIERKDGKVPDDTEIERMLGKL